MMTPRPTVLGLAPSFGFGDRIGLATPGHISAMQKAGDGISPIYAQQSIREMTRTRRSPEKVMSDAMQALASQSWRNPHGADADHLKTPKDVDCTAAAGFTFFTIDPSDHVDQKADDYDKDTLCEKFKVAREYSPWTEHYEQRSIKLSTNTTVDFDEITVMRAAVKYGRAIHEACQLAKHIEKVHSSSGTDYEIELSVDETEQPTTLAEHYIIAEQCLHQGMKLVSLAPRFIGDFEKGVDFIGCLEELEASLNEHASIAEHLGPYKISLHSGSDKLSMYGPLARATKGRFHVKTAGTSYLEALRVVAIHESMLFREICNFSRQNYEKDRATYHVHATLDNVPGPDEITDDVLLKNTYLESWEEVQPGKGFTAAGRQILHCTFGSVLTDPRLGPALEQCLKDQSSTYEEVLSLHFSKHLEALREGL